MATIQERAGRDGKPRYRVLVRKRGFAPQSATFERKTDAKSWAKSVESAMEEGRYRDFARAKQHTLGELIDVYIEDYLSRKPRSYRTQKPQLLWWKKVLGEKRLSDLTSDVIMTHRNKLAKRVIGEAENERTISPSSVNRYHAALSHALTVAVKELRWLPNSPIRSISKLPEPKGRTRYLDDDERKNLLKECLASSNVHLYAIVVLALSTGMRKGEILSLRWPQIDLERGIIVLNDTKNGEHRGVPLVGKALEIVKDYDKARTDEDEIKLLFPGVGGDKPIEVKKAWQKALEMAKIEDFRFHDLRHSAASYLAMNGASLPELAAVLGHKTYEMVKRYSHLSDSHVSSVVERMNNKVFGDG